MSEKLWIRRSLHHLKQELLKLSHHISRGTIRRLLHERNIRPKSNRKRLATTPNPQRDTQFCYIQHQRQAFEQLQQPIISIDTKKRELIGNFAQAGQTWCEEGESVLMHDFPSDALGKAIPHGIYDVGANEGFLCVGNSRDTAMFAVDNLVDWWQQIGCWRYPQATDILILADGGGSNSHRSRLWKQQLQLKLADLCDLIVTVTHYPTGASKWNPIEHRLFSQISRAWAGIPLTSFDRLLEGIRHTTTESGLQVYAQLVTDIYHKGIKISDVQMAQLNLQRHRLCPQWNYTIYPRRSVS